MEGRHGILRSGEDFFVKFLAGTQAGIFNLDIFVGLETGQGNHLAGQGIDLDAFAHIEDKNVVALGHRGGFHDEAAGFRDGHEEAGDARVRHGDGTAFGDLLAETRDNRSIAAKDVAEAGGDETGLAGVLALFDGEAKALDINLSKALGAAHDVGRIDGLVGRDHHHLIDAVFDALVSYVTGAVDIDQDGFARIVLHQRHVFVSRSVEDNLRVPFAESIVQARELADVADDRDEVQVGEFIFEFEPDGMHRGLGIVEKKQLLDAEAGELASQFGADGAGGAGYLIIQLVILDLLSIPDISIKSIVESVLAHTSTSMVSLGIRA